jgi:hypothetical protein
MWGQPEPRASSFTCSSTGCPGVAYSAGENLLKLKAQGRSENANQCLWLHAALCSEVGQRRSLRWNEVSKSR